MEPFDPNLGITFGLKGNYNRFELEGISSMADEHITWTVEPFAAITFSLTNLRPAGRINISAIPFLGNGLLKAQHLWLHINGFFVGYGIYDAEGVKEFAAGDVLRVGVNRLSFVLPDAISPAQLGVGDDLRTLGLGLRQITLNTLPAPNRPGARR